MTYSGYVWFDYERPYKPSVTKVELTSNLPSTYNQGLCPSTYVHTPLHSLRSYGVQCKYRVFHNGRHCGYSGFIDGDIFWDD